MTKIWVITAVEDPGELTLTICGFTDEVKTRQLAKDMEQYKATVPNEAALMETEDMMAEGGVEKYYRLDKEWHDKSPLGPFPNGTHLMDTYTKFVVWELPIF